MKTLSAICPTTGIITSILAPQELVSMANLDYSLKHPFASIAVTKDFLRKQPTAKLLTLPNEILAGILLTLLQHNSLLSLPATRASALQTTTKENAEGDIARTSDNTIQSSASKQGDMAMSSTSLDTSTEETTTSSEDYGINNTNSNEIAYINASLATCDARLLATAIDFYNTIGTKTAAFLPRLDIMAPVYEKSTAVARGKVMQMGARLTDYLESCRLARNASLAQGKTLADKDEEYQALERLWVANIQAERAFNSGGMVRIDPLEKSDNYKEFLKDHRARLLVAKTAFKTIKPILLDYSLNKLVAWLSANLSQDNILAAKQETKIKAANRLRELQSVVTANYYAMISPIATFLENSYHAEYFELQDKALALDPMPAKKTVYNPDVVPVETVQPVPVDTILSAPNKLAEFYSNMGATEKPTVSMSIVPAQVIVTKAPSILDKLLAAKQQASASTLNNTNEGAE